MNKKRIIENSRFFFKQSNFEYENVFLSKFIKIWNWRFRRFRFVIFVCKINWLKFQEILKRRRFSIWNDILSKFLKRSTKNKYICVSFDKKFDRISENRSIFFNRSIIKKKLIRKIIRCNDNVDNFSRFFAKFLEFSMFDIDKTLKFKRFDNYNHWNDVISDESQFEKFYSNLQTQIDKQTIEKTLNDYRKDRIQQKTKMIK